MGRSVILVLLAACCAALAAQQPARTAADQDAAIDFQSTLPPDWTVIAPRPPQATPSAQLSPKGTACIHVAQTARHGDPASVIVIVELPFACFGQTMEAGDLPGFGSGAADGLKQVFDLTNPVVGTYALGSHSFWIERAKGNPKGQAGVQYTMEIACSVLKKGAVCWMAMAADEASLRAFEQMPVALDGEAATPLVPSISFSKPPAAN